MSLSCKQWMHCLLLCTRVAYTYIYSTLYSDTQPLGIAWPVRLWTFTSVYHCLCACSSRYCIHHLCIWLCCIRYSPCVYDQSIRATFVSTVFLLYAVTWFINIHNETQPPQPHCLRLTWTDMTWRDPDHTPTNKYIHTCTVTSPFCS